MSRQTTRLMVLGVIAYRGPVGGYGIEKIFQEWAVSRWTSIAPASIYQQLRTLSAHGLIEPISTDAGSAAEYRCVAPGQAELRRLLLEVLSERDVRPLSLIPLLHFTPSLTDDELDRGLAERIRVIDEALGFEDEMLGRASALGPAHVAEIFRLTIHGLRADRQWCQEFRERLATSTRQG